MKGKKGLDWIPIYIDKHIFGSTRLELEPDERSVWQDLLILSGKDNGHVRANEGMPYPHLQLAGLFNVPVELLERTIKKCCSKEVGKIEILKDGTIFLPGYENYKLSPRHKRRLEREEEEKEIERGEYRGSKKTDMVSAFPDIDPEDIRLTQLLIDLMLENNENSSVIKNLTEKRQKDWLTSCRLMRERDKRSIQDIERLIIWSQNNRFWKSVILSIPKFREKFDTLWLQATDNKFSGVQSWLEKRRKEREGK